MAELFIPTTKWRRLLADLWIRSEGVHESGAFLLGTAEGTRRCIVSWVLYDDFDPRSLDSGIVTLDGSNLGRLWDYCKAHSFEVVADIHTHPKGTRQSRLDQDNPMIAIPGHLALIVPRFARPPVAQDEIGIYEYLGEKNWATCEASSLIIGS